MEQEAANTAAKGGKPGTAGTQRSHVTANSYMARY
jgi:hypothetical protein